MTLQLYYFDCEQSIMSTTKTFVHSLQVHIHCVKFLGFVSNSRHAWCGNNFFFFFFFPATVSHTAWLFFPPSNFQFAHPGLSVTDVFVCTLHLNHFYKNWCLAKNLLQLQIYRSILYYHGKLQENGNHQTFSEMPNSLL